MFLARCQRNFCFKLSSSQALVRVSFILKGNAALLSLERWRLAYFSFFNMYVDYLLMKMTDLAGIDANSEARTLTFKGFFPPSKFKINVCLWGCNVLFLSFLNISFGVYMCTHTSSNCIIRINWPLRYCANEPEFDPLWIMQDYWPLFLFLSHKKNFTFITFPLISLSLHLLCSVNYRIVLVECGNRGVNEYFCNVS